MRLQAVEVPQAGPQTGYRGVQTIILLLLILAVLVPVAQQPVNLGSSDFWVHAGSIEIFSRDLSAPGHTYGVDPAISGKPTSSAGLRPRHVSPWQLLLSVIKRVAGLSSVQAMLVGSVLAVLALFTGMILFGSELNRLTGHRWLTTMLPVSVLLLVGTGPQYSGNVNWNLLPEVAAYPSTVVIALGFLGWTLVLKLLRDWRNLSAVALVMVSCLSLIVHQLQCLFFMVFAFCIVMFSGRELATGMVRLKVGLLLAAALPLATLWPYFNPFEMMYRAVQLGPEIARGPYVFFSAKQIIEIFGVALLGLPLAFFVSRQFRYALVAYLGITIFMWFAALVIELPSAGHRWAFAALLGMQISLAFTLSKAAELAGGGWYRTFGSSAVVLGCFAVLLWVPVEQVTLAKQRYPDIFPFSTEFAQQRDIHRWARFASAMPAPLLRKTLIADPYASFSMTAFGLTPVLFSSTFRKKVPSPTVVKLKRMYDPATPAAERCDLLRSLGHAYYLVDTQRDDPRVINDLVAMGGSIYSAEGISLYRMRVSLACPLTK